MTSARPRAHSLNIYDALDHVFASIGRAGLRLSMKKCEFGVPEIKFLGWTISKQGIGPQKDKIDAQLAIIKMLRNVKTTQRMIGFMQYYRTYIPWLSKKLLPFYKLTRPGAKWKVGLEHYNALKQLKLDLKHATERVLRLPLAGKQFVLMTDASDWAAGYVLLIEDYTKDQEGKETKTYAPVAFGSKKFTQGQYNMTTHAKEFLAVYYAFDSFAHILVGHHRQASDRSHRKQGAVQLPGSEDIAADVVQVCGQNLAVGVCTFTHPSQGESRGGLPQPDAPQSAPEDRHHDQGQDPHLRDTGGRTAQGV